MINHPNRSKIFSLAVINPDAQTQRIIDSELSASSYGAKDRVAFEQYLLETERHAILLGFAGERYHVPVRRVMLDLENFRLKPQFEKLVLADAVKQVVRELHPERKYVQVDVTWGSSTDDEAQSEWQAGIWWEHRRRYEERFFHTSYY